jgi:hypothetical protein
MIRAAIAINAQGGSDARSGLCDFDDRDTLNRSGGGPDVRSGLSGLPARVYPGGQLLRMPLHVAATVQRVGLGPRRRMRHQSIFCERASARATTLSPRLLSFPCEIRGENRQGACVILPSAVWSVAPRQRRQKHTEGSIGLR